MNVRRVLAGGALLLAVAVATYLGGRPAQLDHVGVRHSAATIESLQAEATQLNRIVRRGDGLPRTTSVRAREMAQALDDEAAALAEARISTSDQQRATRAITKARSVSASLRRLARSPTTSVRDL